MTQAPQPAAVPDEEYVDLWRLSTDTARAVAADAERFDDLQTVLRCCERILPELGLAEAGSTDAGLLVEALWTVALTSYARCFSPDADGKRLTEEDVVNTQPEHPDLRDWHRALMRLLLHYTSDSVNPREAFLVSVARGEDGAPAGVALTSAVQPPLDHATVRGAGTIAYALSAVVDERIGVGQAALFTEAAALEQAELDKLERWQAARPVQPAGSPPE